MEALQVRADVTAPNTGATPWRCFQEYRTATVEALARLGS
jgi:hypothetical protein